MKKKISYIVIIILTAFTSLTSCIEPPLYLPGEELQVVMPEVYTDIDVAWDVETDIQVKWHYGWDKEDTELFDSLGYPMPTVLEVRRLYNGQYADGNVISTDAFTTTKSTFRKYFEFGYYDMLFWSDVDKDNDVAPNLQINEQDVQAVQAYTKGNHGMYGLDIDSIDTTKVIGLHDQPEMFYGAFPQDIYISTDLHDYEYDSINNVYIKHIEAKLKPLVYVYLFQIVLHNNHGIVQAVDGNAAISSLAGSVNVNTGHTGEEPSMVYMNTRMKQNIDVDGENCDIIGGRLNTFGLCDMDRYDAERGTTYQGGQPNFHNYIYFDMTLADGSVKTYRYDVTDQMQANAYGGIITLHVDCESLEPIYNDANKMSGLFIPTIEDYEEVIWHVEI